MIGLKTLILTVMITTVAAAAQPDVAIGQTEQHREAADIPPELLPTLEKELKNPFPECSEQRFKEDVGVEWFDLTVCDVMHGDYVTTKPLPFSMNRHKPAALLVEGAGGCAGGGNDGSSLNGVNWTPFVGPRVVEFKV